jgi:uncharacterized protein
LTLDLASPYEIEFEGRTYCGDAVLREHRIIERDGAYSLFRVQDMAAVPISEALAKAIARFMPGPGSLAPYALMQPLRACGLVVEEGTEPEPPPLPRQRATLPVINLLLFVTQTCNMNCVYCFGRAGEYGHPGVMSTETATAAVDWLIRSSLDAKLLSICFFGGEPLLNFPLVKQVVTYAKERARAQGKEVVFSISTNATLLTEEIMAFLKQEKVEPLISFDGPPDIHNRQRQLKHGGDSYDIVRTNVQKLRSAFPNLTARATVCGGTDPFAVRQSMEEAGFAAYHLSPVSPVILPGVDSDKNTPTPETAADQMLDYHRREAVDLFSAITDRRSCTANASAEMSLLALLAGGQKRHVACCVGREMRAVAANGDIYPCHRFVGLEDALCGNISDYEAGGINDYHRAVVENLPVCSTCWARYFCGGGCFYYNQAYTGSIHRPHPRFCSLMQTVCEDLICGWCGLEEPDQSWLREQVKDVDV